MTVNETTGAEGRPAHAGRPALIKRLTPPRKPPRRPAPVGHARETGDRRLGYLLVAPVVILLLAITAYPLIYNVWNSFHFDNLSYGGLPHNFVGWANFTKMFKSHAWVAALERTLGFTVVTIVFDMVVGIGLALMMHRQFRGRGFLRASVLVPWAMPTVVSAMLWKTMFDPSAGFVDYILGAFHPAWSSLAWLNINTLRAWTAIFIADSWKNIPFVAILLLAGLQVIPNDVYEAARMDGASWWQSFTRVTLPLLKPALSVALIFRTLQALLVFDVIYIMTGGGPGSSTESLSYLSYQTFIVNTDFGLGGAMSIILVILALVVSFVYVRAFRPST
ncbi:MAG TPA: sugar ABC transporter permease [Trebonia sp.]|jgi:multiple sugar transport system permease protein|nr:sugar ABC transporter permease [Trebonia sp.]